MKPLVLVRTPAGLERMFVLRRQEQATSLPADSPSAPLVLLLEPPLRLSLDPTRPPLFTSGQPSGRRGLPSVFSGAAVCPGASWWLDLVMEWLQPEEWLPLLLLNWQWHRAMMLSSAWERIDLGPAASGESISQDAQNQVAKGDWASLTCTLATTPCLPWTTAHFHQMPASPKAQLAWLRAGGRGGGRVWRSGEWCRRGGLLPHDSPKHGG